MPTDRPSEALVKAQYQAHPYPPRREVDRAADEAQGCLDGLARLNHHLWSGARRFDNGFRVLVAGGGTGDATVRLARQLAALGGPFEVVHLDLSATSMATARDRLARWGLADRVRFVEGSLLDAGSLGLGTFDYINCSGVLHHLDSPDDGLAALVSVLAEDGGIGLMLYGELGRTGVYDIQAILRVTTAGLPDGARIDIARRLLRSLPATNRLRVNPLGYGDPEALSDADIVDLFLHPCDRAYTVDGIRALLAGAGLDGPRLVPGWIYRPDWLLDDPVVARQARLLAPGDAARVGELLVGAIPTHSLFAARKLAPRAGLDDAVRPIPATSSLAEAIEQGPEADIATLAFAKLERGVALPPGSAKVLATLDGRRTVAEARAVAGIPDQAFDAALSALIEVLGAADLLWLSHTHGATYSTPTAPPMLG